MDEYLSLTEIGRIYDVSSHKVGKWLRNLGLRAESGQPSATAFSDGFVSRRPSTQPGTYYYVWSASKTIKFLDGMGYPRTMHSEEQRQHRLGDS